jgi:hypothetical protein
VAWARRVEKKERERRVCLMKDGFLATKQTTLIRINLFTVLQKIQNNFIE